MDRPRSRFRLLLACILVLCAVGAWTSGELLVHHAHAGGAGTGLLGRLCTAAGPGFDCTGALASPWSEIRLPVPWIRSGGLAVRRVTVPIAFLGLAYFTGMGTWFALVGGPRRFGVGWQRLPLHAVRAAAVTSVFYLGLMALRVAPWCAGCVLVHAASLALLIAVRRLHRREPDATPAPADAPAAATDPIRAARETLTAREALGAVAVALALVGGLWLHRDAALDHRRRVEGLRDAHAVVRTLQTDPAFLLREFAAQPTFDIAPRAGEPAAGPGVELVIFSDYGCPGCACREDWLRDTARPLFGDMLTVRVRHHPLSGTADARAAEAARLQGGPEAFARMHERLFEHRFGSEPAPAPTPHRALAAAIGLDPDRLLRDMEGETVRAIVAADLALARRLGVTATPTMFLDGRRVPVVCDSPLFWQAMADARRAAPPEGDPTTLTAARR
jgi:predicted DsbA family dithiol-disulfide isomerase